MQRHDRQGCPHPWLFFSRHQRASVLQVRGMALRLFLIALISLPCLSANALFMRRTIPNSLLQRLIRNSQRNAQTQPDAMRHGTVARLHTLAVCGDADGLERQEIQEHVLTAIREYQNALAMEPRAVFFHGLGYAYEEALRLNVTAAGPAANVRAQAVAAYLAARSLAKSESSRSHHRPGFLDTIDAQTELALERVGAIAGEGQDSKNPPQGGKQKGKDAADGDKEKGDKGKKDKKDKQKRKRPAPERDYDTPVIYGDGDSVEDLIDADRRVSFDIAGDGQPRRWPWVRPTTGVLVWDPSHEGQITSGQQLFGLVTWWIFWSDGYRALAALDDDGDGWLRGDELDGIGVWYDRNGNGISDAGEVLSREQAGIVQIAVRATAGPDGVLTHPRGVVLRDRSFKSFDWRVNSIPGNSALPGPR